LEFKVAMEEGKAIAIWRDDRIGAPDPALDPDRGSRQVTLLGEVVEVPQRDGRGSRQSPAGAGIRPAGPDQPDPGDDSQPADSQDEDGEGQVVHDRMVARCSLTGAEVCGTSAVSEAAETVGSTSTRTRRRRLYR
jgi:hypothetical protein